MKTLKLLAIFFGSALFFMSCDKEGHKKDAPPPPPAAMAPVVRIEAPSSIISVQEAEDMYYNYGEKTASLIEKAMNTDANGKAISSDDAKYVQATRSLSIDYKTLKQYLAFIEQEAKESKTDITGLRIYLSSYSEKVNDGRTSVFLNPIMEAGDGGITDDVSFAIQTVGKTKKAIPVGKIVKVPDSNTNKSNLEQEISGDGIQSLAANRFPWSPPPEDDPDDFH